MKTDITLSTSASEFYLNNEEVFLRGIPETLNVRALSEDSLRLLVYYLSKSSPFNLALDSGYFKGNLGEWLASLKATFELKATIDIYEDLLELKYPEKGLYFVVDDESLYYFDGATFPPKGSGIPFGSLSAYDVAVSQGYTGSPTEWLNSLKGQPFLFSDFTEEQLKLLQGPKGDRGSVGLNAYQLAVQEGRFIGTLSKWLDEQANATESAERAEKAADNANNAARTVVETLLKGGVPSENVKVGEQSLDVFARNVERNKADSSQLLPQQQTTNSFKGFYSTQQADKVEMLRSKTAVGRVYVWKNPKYTNGTVSVNPFTADATQITGVSASNYTVVVRYNTGEEQTVVSVGTTWTIPNTYNKTSEDIADLKAFDPSYRFSLGMNMNGWNTIEWDFVADVDNFYRMRYGYTGAIRAPMQTLNASNFSTQPVTNSDNAYFRSDTQLNAMFNITFTGVGILFNHYVDNNGGVFEVSIDGAPPVTISTHIDNIENANVKFSRASKQIGGDLENKQHTVSFKFIGSDPNHPPSGDYSRGWFKLSNGVEPEDYTANVISGDEMGITSSGTTLVATNILEFAIGGSSVAGGHPMDWIPAHGSASGAILVNDRKLFINNKLVDDKLSGVSSETELKEFTMIQDYTAYNTNDTTKRYPLWHGVLVTKFDRNSQLTYTHEFKALNDFTSNNGYTAMGAGRKTTAGFTSLEFDNGLVIDISGDAPSVQKTHFPKYFKSVLWKGGNVELAMKSHTPEASCANGKPYNDGEPTVATERVDGFVKVYFKCFGTNGLVPKDSVVSSKHSVFIATV